MFTLKDKYILGYITAIWVYLAFRTYHTASMYGNYDFILLSIIIFGGWLIGFNYRMFTMTKRKLTNYYHECPLSYVYFMKNGLINRIFVQTHGSEDWYELDYILTIPRDCDLATYNSFVTNNGTVDKLLRTMNNMESQPLVKQEYKLLKNEYNTIRWMLLFKICMLYFLYTLVHNQTLIY